MSSPIEKLHDRGLRRMRRRTAATGTPLRAAQSEHRPQAKRRWIASTAVCVVGVMAAARMPLGPMADAAEMVAYSNGVTYCWQVGGSLYASDLNHSISIQQATDNECPLTLSLDIPNDSYFVGEAIQLTWTATLRRDSSGVFSTNAFGVEELFVAQDRVSQKQFEIVYSRLESCEAGATDCNPVNGHTDLVANVANKPANFSSAGIAPFSTSRIAFSSSGNVTLVAHLILPGEDPDQKRYDFALYKTIAIKERPTLSPVRNESSESQSQINASSAADKKGLSTEVIGIMFVCGMVAVALVAVGFVMMKKSKAPPCVEKGPDAAMDADTSTTDLDDEFAMLSNEERMMQSQVGRSKRKGFLSATSGGGQLSMFEESRAKAKGEAPLPFVGKSTSSQSHDRRDIAVDDHMVDPSNPSSMRQHGLYMEMPAPMTGPRPSRTTASKIFYNDIHEDEIVGSKSNRRNDPRAQSSTSSMSSTMNPFSVARDQSARRPVHSVADRLANGSGLGSAPVDDAWRVSTELTFDDLRPSADLGPALTMDDLFESKQLQRKNRASKAVSDVSEK